MSLSAAARRVPRVLVIDDDSLVRRTLAHFLAEKGYAHFAADEGTAGLALVERERPDVVVLDNVLPGLGGIEVLKRIRELDRHLPVLFVTSQGTSRTAIEAMKLCAFDYLPKPLDLARLEQQLDRALEARRLMRTPVQVDDGSGDGRDVDLLIGRSPAMQDVYKSIGRVALLDAPILIEGESGTGKESVARAVYQNGTRSDRPLRIVNCSDFEGPELEVELFGSEETNGDATITTHVGRVEQCLGGTLVLHEIGRLTSSAQSRLLRLLRDKEFERVGGRSAIAADVQVIALTSQELEQLVDQKRFRTDLYYLLRAFRIELPSLRHRADDVPLLVDHFVKQFSRLRGTLSAEPVRVSAESLALLKRYSWPGNLDELQSVLRRALVETKGTIVASDFLSAAIGDQGSAARNPASAIAGSHVTDWRALAEERIAGGSRSLYAEALAEMERSLLAQVLDAMKGNQARSARILGITRGNLRKKLRSLGLAAVAPKPAHDGAGGERPTKSPKSAPSDRPSDRSSAVHDTPAP